MKLNLFFITSFLMLPFVSLAQKSFDLTIKLDSSINPQKVHYQYYDGKNITLLPDTFGNRREIVIKSDYYSPLASFNISYTDPSKTSYENVFFISDKQAMISFYFKANDKNKLGYISNKNAIPIFDTTINKTYRKLLVCTTDTAIVKENEAFESFLTHNHGFAKNDSLMQIFKRFQKSYLNRTMLFLKKYPDDYFSFWYFIQYVAQPNNLFSKDTAYLKEQLIYINSVFPAKFTQSIEGKELIKSYKQALTPPLQLNEAAPLFVVTGIDGKKISLNELKGKYVLLDFWATWCPPCMAEIPFIKEIRKKYPPEKLVIIGINHDRDPKALTTAAKKYDMNWLHFFDRNLELGNLYKIEAIPTLVLIDKAGKLVYLSDFKQSDKDSLPKVLEGIK